MNNYVSNYDDCKPMRQYYNETRCHPNEVLYERRCAKYIYIVPDGLRELMSDISREVLRCQPIEIYCFIADYLDALIITRENARVAAMFVENVTEAGVTLHNILQRTNLTMNQAMKAVKIIQRAFRKHLARNKPPKIIQPIDPELIICKLILRLNISHQKASEAARTIQVAWKSYKARADKWRARFNNAVEWRDAARYTLQLYKNYASSWEYTRAATLIQAAYRGYYTRKIIRYWARKKPKAQDMELLDYLDGEYEEQVEYVDFYDRRRLSDHTSITTDESMETLYVMYDKEDKAARIIQRIFQKYVKRLSAIDDGTTRTPHGSHNLEDDLDGLTVQPTWTPHDLKILEDQIRREIDE